MTPHLRGVWSHGAILAISSALSFMGRIGVSKYVHGRLNHCGLVLMFHHVSPQPDETSGLNSGLTVSPQTLDYVLRSLAAHDYEIVPMDDLPGRLRSDMNRGRFAVLTFDDGCRDTLLYAAPILARFQAPFTVYATTGFVDGTTAPWWHVVERAVRATASLDVDTADGPRRFDTSTGRNKKVAAAELHRILWRTSKEWRTKQTQSLATQARIELPALTRELYMDWSELRLLASTPGCTVGCHTVTHPKLSELSELEAALELTLARDTISRQLGIEVRHLAYPYGGIEACGEPEFDLARRLGFETAVTTRRGVLQPNGQWGTLSLPRVPINGNYQSPEMIDALTSGLPLAAYSFVSSLGKGGRRPKSAGIWPARASDC